MYGVERNVKGRVDLYLMRLSILTRCFFISRSSVFRRFNSISCWAWRREEEGRGGRRREEEGGGERRGRGKGEWLGRRGRGRKEEAWGRRDEGEEEREREKRDGRRG